MRRSLDGLSVGDAFGERSMLMLGRWLMEGSEADKEIWPTTDDTEMACVIVALLEEKGRIDQDELARRFAARHKRDPDRGYGGGAHRILNAISRGEDWRVVSKSAFGGQGSMGNGGAMRAAPLGAFFAEDVARVVSEAKLSAEVTHAHPEGQAGAVAVALAAAWAARNEPGDLLEFVLRRLEIAGDTRSGIARALNSADLSPMEAADALGNGSSVISSDTVPFCLWMARRYLGDYRAALRVTAEQGGDVDTTCAIVGGIVSLRSPIPPDWLKQRERLRF